MATGNMKTIKRRIKSVSSTMQITKAMELVASSKLRRAKKKSKDARPYFEAQVRMLVEISKSLTDEKTGNTRLETDFAAHRECKCENKNDKKCEKGECKSLNSLYIVIAGDRGLAGGYNSAIFKKVAEEHKERGLETKPKIIAIGKKTVEYFEKRGDTYDLIAKHIGLAEEIKSGRCAAIANSAIKLFLDHEVDEVKLFYTKFISSMTQQSETMPLLPMPLCPQKIGGVMRDESKEIKTPKDINYDPTPQAVFNRIVPCFLMSIVQCAITESYTSEQCARRLAMESASDNAEDMIDNLSLLYNRARQEKITNEINEIVGGANAL
jgi:F-type H+-transporting ATPase subunit gamma